MLKGIKMNLKNCQLYILFAFCTAFPTVNLTIAAVEVSNVSNGSIRIEARDSTIGTIVKEFYDKYSIEIKGLEDRESQIITFSYIADTPESLLKGLLRHIGIKNYAFEFADATLRRLVVVPEAADGTFAVADSPKESNPPKDLVSIAQVQSVVEASQAESAGLQAGDIILEYDGVSISSAQQLVSEVEKKAANHQIEMVFVRQKIPTRLVLSGGFIGVRIVTKKIPRAEFNAFQ